MKPTELQARLEAEVMEVEWEALKPHQARDALIYVSPAVPLVKVAMAVHLDFAADVQAWMADGAVSKVREDLAAAWQDDLRFRFLIVQPFVLIQPILDAAS
jgi:hypothetical protein